MKTFRVKNFEKFQHYKDRNPPWIKLYNDVLDDYAYASLPDASKYHLSAIWLLASRSNNSLPFDPQWIANRINAKSPVDLEILVQAGFIVLEQALQTPEQVASKTLHTPEQSARPETETETETETEGEGRARTSAPRPKASRLPDGWLPSAELAEWTKRECPRIDCRVEAEKFRDYWRSKPGSSGVKLDWDATWRNWVRKAQEFGKGKARASPDGYVPMGNSG